MIAKLAVVLIFHGGGFIGGQPSLPDAEATARAYGLQPVEVSYPLGNPLDALTAAEHAAWRFRHRTVLAYGESAGGDLAVRLAQEGRVAAATSWLAPPDLNATSGALATVLAQTGATPGELRAVSPAAHRSGSPVLAEIAADDALVDPATQLAWAEHARRTEPLVLPGTHVFPTTTEQRQVQLDAAMSYLRRYR